MMKIMNVVKRKFDGKVTTLLLSFLIVVAGVGIAPQVIAGTDSYVSKTGATLEHLIKLAEEPVQRTFSNEFDAALTRLAEEQILDVSIRFTHELSQAEIGNLEAQGLTFVRINGEVAHSGTIYGAEVSLDMLEILKALPDTVRIESTRRPGTTPTLDVSVPEIKADVMWKLIDGLGDNITGKGIIVADFDTGIDVFHPDFWYADGPLYNWIDTNSNGIFDRGIDAVNLNGNATADTGEILDFFDAEGPAGNNDGDFQVDMDWLYNDANNNGKRDYGTAAGFTEADPTFGELIFIVDDTDGDNELDVGESLIALGTSKVRMTLNVGRTVRTRGTDLILNTDDKNWHGTSVCGIINGGIIGKRKFVGVAPDAELLVVDKYSDYDETFYIPWARINGADVMLYEFGDYVLHFLDGSSNYETMIDNEAAQGIVQVVAAGNLGNNLGNNEKHAEDDVSSNGSTNFMFNVPSMDDPNTPVTEPDISMVTITALWRTTGNDLAFRVTTPTPSAVNLPAAPGDTDWHSITTTDGHTIDYRRENSTEGTAKYDILIDRNNVVLGNWTIQVTNKDANNYEHVDVYIYNNNRYPSKWSGGAVWTAFQSNENTVTWPATADSAITVASYYTRGGATGDLRRSSSNGPRVDGQAVVDVTAPGGWSGSALSKDKDPGGGLGWYTQFTGTSAAAPHVVGAIALLLQWDNTLTPAQIKTMLQQNARTDGFTGVTPNNKWGYGKLDVSAVVNEPPVCNANGPYTAECGGETTTITLNGTGSSDPNTSSGDILTYSWNTDCYSDSFDDDPVQILSLDPGCYDCNVSLTVTDIAGESDTCSSTVTLTDTQPPTLSCPADVTVACDDSTLPSNTGTATASDVCDSSPLVTFSDDITPGTCPEEFTIERTWTATDGCQNISSCTQTISVVDTTPPMISRAPNRTIECDEPTDPRNTGFSTATDNCDSAPAVTYADVETPGSCPEEKTITRTWTATDGCGNTSSYDQIIQVVDTTAPVISFNAPPTIIPPDAPISFEATATDNCDSDPSIVITGYDCFFFTKKGKRIDKKESCVVTIADDTITILDSGGVDAHIKWDSRVTDNCGNVAEDSFEIIVVNPVQQ